MRKLLLSLLVCLSAGVAGSVFTVSAIAGWYAGLVKPSLSPPNWVFGPVWTTLYILMGVSLYLVWKRDWKIENEILSPKKKAWNRWSERFWVGDLQKQNVIAIFTVQLLLNAIWSFVFFGLHQPGWAFFVLVALWCSIVYVIVNFYRISKTSAWLLLPYLAWVSFAGYLNLAIWLLNG